MYTTDAPLTIDIELKEVTLKGQWSIPKNAIGLVIFSHGSGSSRLSPRNQYVARHLQESNLATLLFDLLTAKEDAIYKNRFNIDLLTKRLINVTQWMQTYKEVQHLPIGYFGASTGAASALKAAAILKNEIKAVVSRGGRPDLALDKLDRVTAPTLFLVGEFDTTVIDLNRKAYEKLNCDRNLEIISGASHLFEEKGKLEEVVKHSTRWFVEKMKPKTVSYVSR